MATSPTSQPPSLTNLPDGLSPDCLDTIPVLSAILARLQPPQNANVPASTAGSPPAAATPKLVKDLENGTGPLTVNQIPIAADGIKSRLQKARAQVKQLPDMERSIAEQEQEMRELEEKIKKQRAALVHLKEVGSAIKREREQKEKEGGADLMETGED
ncbi:uncharacterized protein LY89DRAFT_247479 [Mollisia scopiformis]|uniref:Mediator of RNA polymerase II transcription subunit 9 n=1 Tax=Mollisia scopiformis TaxID=149040 RepID=A0A194WRL1_MOLSC|nr:uncharacterized protein LY89DRAFT_247479 [Mollisia scopiformis]KUJ10641.1 hypothetical protein LY89DRAFT_247479 [Mollisia scopiformis]